MEVAVGWNNAFPLVLPLLLLQVILLESPSTLRMGGWGPWRKKSSLSGISTGTIIGREWGRLFSFFKLGFELGKDCCWDDDEDEEASFAPAIRENGKTRSSWVGPLEVKEGAGEASLLSPISKLLLEGLRVGESSTFISSSDAFWRSSTESSLRSFSGMMIRMTMAVIIISFYRIGMLSIWVFNSTSSNVVTLFHFRFWTLENFHFGQKTEMTFCIHKWRI